MNEYREIVWLFIALCFLSMTSLSSAQNQKTQVATGSQPNRLQTLEKLAKRLQDVSGELASIREQMKGPQSPDSKRKLLERADRVEMELRHLRDELHAVEERDASTGQAPNAANSGCCESIETETANGRVQMEGRDKCEKADMKAAKMGLQSTLVREAVSGTCLAARVIQSQRVANLAIDQANERGLLTKGQNEFCLQFRNIRDNSPADPGEVRAEATMALGQVKAVRAVVKLSRANVDRYCAHVNFPLSGVWAIAVKHEGRLSKGKTVFLATVN